MTYWVYFQDTILLRKFMLDKKRELEKSENKVCVYLIIK